MRIVSVGHHLTFSATACLLCFAFQMQAVERDTKFEGAVKATLTRAGAPPTEFLFTRKGDQLRMEDAATNKREPVNLVDLASGKLTIVFPHNSTFVRVAATKTPMPPGAPPLPAGFSAPPNPNPVGEAASFPRTSSPTSKTLSPPPGSPTPPPMPSMAAMPQMPPGPIGGAPIGAGGAPALPNPMPPSQGYGAQGMPAMPPMPGMSGASELKKSDKTRTIHGLECTLYTLSDHGQNFEIWAASDAALFPFRLLQRDFMSRHFGPQMLEEQWVELLGKKSLFPLEAILRMEPGGQERLSFKVDRIEKKKVEDQKLFQPPDDYHEIQAPQF